jgi:hypothetical protein
MLVAGILPLSYYWILYEEFFGLKNLGEPSRDLREGRAGGPGIRLPF